MKTCGVLNKKRRRPWNSLDSAAVASPLDETDESVLKLVEKANGYAEQGKSKRTASRALLLRALSQLPKLTQPFVYSQCLRLEKTKLNFPPIGLMKSYIFNLLAELQIDDMLEGNPVPLAEQHASCYCGNNSAQRETKIHKMTTHLNIAQEYAEAALRAWPGLNAGAAMNIAQIERDCGRLSRALGYYKRVIGADIPLHSANASNDIDKASESVTDDVSEWISWREDIVLTPHRRCVEVAAYQAAIILSQLGRHVDALEYIYKFGCTARISTEVWACAHKMDGCYKIEELKNVDAEIAPISASQPVRLYHGAIHKVHAQFLRESLHSEAAYWKENNYTERGYFSSWYDLGETPRNAVEGLIQSLLPLTGMKNSLVGAEWWLHSRPVGLNLGHQLHFDTDENAVESERGIFHPAISSVCYLEGAKAGAGPTIIFDQDVNATSLASKCYVAHPEDGAVLFFNGSLLHGVLPGKPQQSQVDICSAEEKLDTHKSKSKSFNKIKKRNRLTLMIGWWETDRESSRNHIGPCAPLPKVTRSTTWPRTLSIEGNDLWAKIAKKSGERETYKDCTNTNILVGSPVPKPVPVIEPAWEVLKLKKDLGEPKSNFLDLPTIDQHFFIRGVETFKESLLCGKQ